MDHPQIYNILFLILNALSSLLRSSLEMIITTKHYQICCQRESQATIGDIAIKKSNPPSKMLTPT